VKTRFYKIKCPGKREHTKRSGGKRVVEDNCSALLAFVAEGEVFDKEVIPCRNCKSLIQISLDGGEISLAVLPKETKLETIDGRCTVDEF
jgi:hypothetical protein